MLQATLQNPEFNVKDLISYNASPLVKFTRVLQGEMGLSEFTFADTETNSANGGTLKVQKVNTSLAFVIDIPAQRQQKPQFRETEMKWIEQHPEKLEQLEGNWVVLEGDTIIASGPNHKLVIQEAEAKGITIPFVFFVPSEEEFAGV